MKSLNYIMSLFKKAVKRDKPEVVFYDDVYYDFWFFTQKAVINYKASNQKEFIVLSDWLLKNGVNLVRWRFAL